MIISKKNDVYVKVDTEPNIARELVDFFTFEVPGARFMPTYKSRVWDGKIRLYNQMSGEIYFGLVPYVEEFAKRNDISIEYGEGVKNEGEHRDAVLGGFVRRVSPKSKGKSLQIRDYQMAAFTHAIRNNRSLSLSPTASGKSLIIYLLSRWYESNRVLILVPTTSLVEQMYTDFLDYGYLESKMQKIYQGYTKDISSEVTISTWQSLYKMPRKFFEQFGCILGDEVHLFKAKSLTNIMNKMHQTQYRHGFTGTLDGTQTHKWVLEGLFGPSYKIIKTDELMKKGHVATLDINVLLLKHPPNKFETFEDEIQYIITHTRRNNFIRNLALDLKGNTLILFARVEGHGEPLYNLINSNSIIDRHVFFVHGGVATEDRERVREITESEDNAIIVASYGTFSTGINIKNLHNIIFASPSKSRIRNLQSIGRVLRKGSNKTKATLYDIADDISYKSRRNYTLNHLIERIKVYNEENFNYDIVNIPLKK